MALVSACGAAAERDTLEGELGASEQALVSDVAAMSRGAGDVSVSGFNISIGGTPVFDPVLGGGVSVARHTCDKSFCTCTGDPECNDMFSGSDCATGPKTAVCQIRDDVPRCRCTRAAKAE